MPMKNFQHEIQKLFLLLFSLLNQNTTLGTLSSQSVSECFLNKSEDKILFQQQLKQ